MTRSRATPVFIRGLLSVLFLTACVTTPEGADADAARGGLPPSPSDLPPALERDTASTRRPDVRAGVLPADAPPPDVRIAEWERRSPGEPIPATIVFERPMDDAALTALMERYDLQPTAGYVRVAGIGGEHRVAPTGDHRLPREPAGASVIEGTRQTAALVARQAICHTAARLESWGIEPPRGWPEARLLDDARAMLAQYDAAWNALRRLEAGAPVLYAVQILAESAVLRRIAGESGMYSVNPALIRDDGLIVVPAPQGAVVHDIAEPVVSDELRRLEPAALVERMRAAGAAPRADCDRRGPVPPPSPPDTVAREDRIPGTIPPAVHPVFSIEGTALGTFRPHEPVEIVARVEADAVVDTAELTITMPELADARRTGWDTSFERLDIGERYPALDSVAGPIRQGTPLRLRRRVTFRAPGYYFVSMVVRARTRPITDRPLPTVDEAFHSFLIWIDDEGGFIARDLDQTRYPIGSETQGGPVRSPARRTEERAMIERARNDPATRAIVTGTVRSAGGEPMPDVRITGRAFMERCPGRGVAETLTRTDDDGRYTIDLPAWPAESFIACVAIHADPPAGSGLAARSVQTETRFLRNPGAPHEVDIVLQPTETLDDPAAGLPLPDPVRAAANAPAYSAIVRVENVDVTGDGAADRIELSADAELNARGEPIFGHGHRWRVVVRSAQGDFALSDDFVPSGDVRIRAESLPIDERGAPPAIVIAWRSRESWGERRLRYDDATRSFITESIVRVMPE